MKQFLVFLLILLGISCSSDDSNVEQGLTDYPNAELLLEPAELDSLSRASELLIIDARNEIPGPVLPEAVHFAATEQLVDPDHPVSGYLVGPEAFQQMMRDLGLNNSDRVIIYDEGNGLSASRLFYALETYGFDRAGILNGGFQGWQQSGFPVVESVSSRAPGDFTALFQPANVCTFEDVVAASGADDRVIFDVRSADEYNGVLERAERNGHIPNAVNLEWNQVLEPDGVPYFLPAAEIQAKYDAMGITRDKEIIPHCQSNVRGSHAYFTLRLMGYDSVRPYEGSWAEYGNRPDAEVE